MLRRSIALGHRVPIGSNASKIPSSWRAATSVQRRLPAQQRYYADSSKQGKGDIPSSDPAFLPGSRSPAAKSNVPPLAGPVAESPSAKSTSPASPSNSVIPPGQVPLTPPPPAPKTQPAPSTQVQEPPKVGSPSSPPPPPPRKKKRSAFRSLLYLILGGSTVYAGSVWFALNNDNFHDFFTEYVPFGEESVLYIQERQFQQKFPHAKHIGAKLNPGRSRDDGNKVTIPQRSGLSWRVKEDTSPGSDLSQKGPHMSAVGANDTQLGNTLQHPSGSTRSEKSAAVDKAKTDAGPRKPRTDTLDSPKPRDSSAQKAVESPKAEEKPAVVAPVKQISPLTVAGGSEPVVQELVKIVNDLITVINADSGDSANKYAQPMEKAKDSLASVGSKISVIRDAAEAEAKNQIEAAHKEFEERARNLINQIDIARAEETAAFREQFEAAREQLAQAYNEKVKAEVQRSSELSDVKLKNELMEQAIELKRKFQSEIRDLVEKERDGRLSKLSSLSSDVSKLQELTSDWNGVIDTNLATQKLQVAVESVRSTLEKAAASDGGRPRPFVRELAALKEVANGDPVVDAAISSINPVAYQKGLPSTSQLVDRFRRVATEVRKASLLPEGAGVASHAASLLLSKVLFKKRGLSEGSDVESILTRTETLLEEGDLDAAAREMNTLHGWAKTLSKDWLADVRKVLEVKQALEVIEAEARLQCLRVE